MDWIVISAWIAAAVVAAVVLGFCAYEIIWKAGRLRADVARLQSATEQLAGLQRSLAEARGRLEGAGLR